MRPAACSEYTLEDTVENTNELYRTESGSDDQLFTTVSTSMLAWGVALALAIGILTATVPNSRMH
jgi:hypothetical protein